MLHVIELNLYLALEAICHVTRIAVGRGRGHFFVIEVVDNTSFRGVLRDTFRSYFLSVHRLQDACFFYSLLGARCMTHLLSSRLSHNLKSRVLTGVPAYKSDLYLVIAIIAIFKGHQSPPAYHHLTTMYSVLSQVLFRTHHSHTNTYLLSGLSRIRRAIA